MEAPPRVACVRDPDSELFQLVSTGAGSLGVRGRRWWPSMPGRALGGGMNQLGFTHLSFNVHDLPGTLDDARRFGVEVMEDTAIVLDPSQPPVAIFLREPDGQLIELLPL